MQTNRLIRKRRQKLARPLAWALAALERSTWEGLAELLGPNCLELSVQLLALVTKSGRYSSRETDTDEAEAAALRLEFVYHRFSNGAPRRPAG